MGRQILAAPDKFRGTATAREICEAIGRAAHRMNCHSDLVPMADGGEGTLEVVGGSLRTSRVTGPLGEPVNAQWVLKGQLAVIEMARASGLALIGGKQNNRVLEATTTGTGELIAAAIKSGATEIVVGLGGSATTDGGLGCIEALHPHSRLREIELIAAVDVETLFLDAAKVFAPQKGATPAQVALLERRLWHLADEYQKNYGIDVRAIPGSGAAGGLGGGLVALGATIKMGFDYLADLVNLDTKMERSDLIITGEGSFDEQSLSGKVAGGVIKMAQRFNVPVVVIAGQINREQITEESLPGVTFLSLVEKFGHNRAYEQTTRCIEICVEELIAELNLQN